MPKGHREDEQARDRVDSFQAALVYPCADRAGDGAQEELPEGRTEENACNQPKRTSVSIGGLPQFQPGENSGRCRDGQRVGAGQGKRTDLRYEKIGGVNELGGLANHGFGANHGLSQVKENHPYCPRRKADRRRRPAPNRRRLPCVRTTELRRAGRYSGRFPPRRSYPRRSRSSP